MDLNALTEGQVFASRYRVVRCIAAGGMGAVYEVQHTETDRRCALKVMLPHIVANPALRERFKREARVTAHIASEFIVDVLDAGVDEASESPFIVMEYLEGNDLSVELERNGCLPPEDVVTYLWQSSLALNKTHAANIVHRDLKPENIFLTRRDDGSPRVKILDFGISKVVEQSTKGNATMTLGTPLYMAPEQFKGVVSPPTDIYALGMIAYTLLVGTAYWMPAPGEEESVFALATRIMEGIPESASVRATRHNHNFPAGFDPWFAKTVNRDVKERFRSATDAVAALGKLYGIELKPVTGTGGATPSLKPPPPTGTVEVARAATSMTSAKDASGPQPLPMKSRTGMVVGISAAVAVLGVGAILAVRMGSSHPAGVAESITATQKPPPPASVTTTPPPQPEAAPPETPSVAVLPSASVPVPATATVPTKTVSTGKVTPVKTGPTETPPATGAAGYSRY